MADKVTKKTAKKMTREDVFEFMRKNRTFSLATCEDTTPHVRTMMLYRVDRNGIIFTTGENKDVNRQLTANPMVEMCFFSSQENRQIRISGTVEVLEDLELKKEVVRNYPFLQEWVDSVGYDVLVVYCLRKGKAFSWTMKTNFSPKKYIEL
jgi:pyridoxamine 5'-phosphate oxidase